MGAGAGDREEEEGEPVRAEKAEVPGVAVGLLGGGLVGVEGQLAAVGIHETETQPRGLSRASRSSAVQQESV